MTCLKFSGDALTLMFVQSNFRQLPRGAARAIQPGVRFLVADESPVLRVPAQLAPIPAGEVREMTNGHAARPDLDVGNRPFARANAIEPVAVVSRRFEEVNVFVGERLFRQIAPLAGAADTDVNRFDLADAAVYTTAGERQSFRAFFHRVSTSKRFGWLFHR